MYLKEQHMSKEINIFDDFDEATVDRYPITQYNTGTPLDLLLGEARPADDGHWYLMGGLSNHIAGVFAIPNCYKTTMCITLISRLCAIYGCDALIVDSEGTMDHTGGRFLRCAGELADRVDMLRVKIKGGVEWYLEKTFAWLSKVCDKRMTHQNSFTIASPFTSSNNPKKKMPVWRPTIFFADTYSNWVSEAEVALLKSEGIDGSKNKTWAMVDGGQKTVFMRQMIRLCEEAGLLMVGTAHVGGNINIPGQGGTAPPAKKTQFMKQKDSLKNVGSMFYKVTNPLLQLDKATVRMTSSKEAEYPLGDTPPNDINEVQVSVVRGKFNMSGSVFPLIVSQNNGFLVDVTYYNYLRSNKYFGLSGNNTTHSVALYPDVKFSRTTMREKSLKDPKLRRALEIMGQYLMLQNYWLPLPGLDSVWHLDGEEFAKRVIANKKIPIDKILETRSYWAPPDRFESEYLSIFDIVELIRQ
jgi:hypothetical protein